MYIFIAHYISIARDTKTDVVLVDTAGRMQDNEPLMRSLAKVWTSLHSRASIVACVLGLS